LSKNGKSDERFVEGSFLNNFAFDRHCSAGGSSSMDVADELDYEDIKILETCIKGIVLLFGRLKFTLNELMNRLSESPLKTKSAGDIEKMLYILQGNGVVEVVAEYPCVNIFVNASARNSCFKTESGKKNDDESYLSGLLNSCFDESFENESFDNRYVCNVCGIQFFKRFPKGFSTCRLCSNVLTKEND
jgi:hypothetical protein